MFNKKDPVFITKICLILICGAFVFSFITAAFSPRVQAQSAASPDELPSFRNLHIPIPGSEDIPPVSLGSFLRKIVETTGIYAFINDRIERTTNVLDETTGTYRTTIITGWQTLLMIFVGFLLIYLGVAKQFEPLLLIPIGFGTVFANIPLAGMAEPGGFLNIIYNAGIGNEFFPLIIFIGVGALTDFGPLIANPKTAILGAAAQFGVFGTLFFVSIANFIPRIAFNLKEACAISIVGGADGPTSIYIASSLAPHLLAIIAVSAYSYMALVPVIQPPIMKLLTTKK